jgi:Ni/Co efflux regulator RcnB
MDFGILICWIAVSCVTITLAQLYVSRRAMREEREKRGGTLNDQEQQAQRENTDDSRESDATRS